MAFKPRALAYQPLSREEAYDTSRLKHGIETSHLVSNLKLDTSKGLSKYAETILGQADALDEADREDIGNSRNYLLNQQQTYEIAHAGQMFGSLEDAVVNAGFIRNPKIKLYSNENDAPYNAVVTAVQTEKQARENVKDENKAREIFKQTVEGFTNPEKAFWANYEGSILRGYVQEAIERTDTQIGTYGGAKKFATEHIKVMATLAEEAPQKQKDLEGKMQKAFEDKTKELGRAPNTRETAEIRDTFADEQKALQEKYGSVGNDLGKYTATLEFAWYQKNFPEDAKKMIEDAGEPEDGKNTKI